MTCRAAHRLLPLFAGKDLEGPKLRALADHLATCAACRAEAEAFAAARTLLPLSSLSFSESERALVRRRVLDEIARRRENPSFFAFPLRPGFALAAVAAVVVLGASLLSPFFVQNAGGPEAVLPARPVLSATPVPNPERIAENIAKETPQAPDPSRAASRGSRARVVARPLSQSAQGPNPAIRFEIQTGNVNVRIIWFAGGAPGGGPAPGPSDDPNGTS